MQLKGWHSDLRLFILIVYHILISKTNTLQKKSIYLNLEGLAPPCPPLHVIIESPNLIREATLKNSAHQFSRDSDNSARKIYLNFRRQLTPPSSLLNLTNVLQK